MKPAVSNSARGQMPYTRRGAIAALTAVLLPVLLILSVFAINVAYMQLTKTELKIATDAAARAAGRALSKYQDIDKAIYYATSTAKRNKVAGDNLRIRTQDVEFGWSQRTNAGHGRYVFSKVNTNAVRNETAQFNAVRVWGKRDSGSPDGEIDLFFKGLREFSTFDPVTSSVSTQVDRDIAMVLDRSGSMAASDIAYTQYLSYQWQQVPTWWGGWRWVQVEVWDPPEMEAAYSAYVSQYINWYSHYGRAPVPDASRWKSLEIAVNAFLDVLEATDQEELVSVATFSSSARLDLNLQETLDYDNIRNLVEDIGNGISTTYRVGGETAIGDGIDSGFPSLIDSLGRPYAAKTVLVLTDGNNNSGSDPRFVTKNILDQHNATFDAVTVSDRADQGLMEEITKLGGGNHYHAVHAAELVTIFEKIANNLPTIISN